MKCAKRAIAEVKQRWWVTKHILSQAPPCFGRHVQLSRLHLQSLAPTNPHWTRVVGRIARSPYV
jgi:hypothetical protein